MICHVVSTHKFSQFVVFPFQCGSVCGSPSSSAVPSFELCGIPSFSLWHSLLFQLVLFTPRAFHNQGPTKIRVLLFDEREQPEHLPEKRQ